MVITLFLQFGVGDGDLEMLITSGRPGVLSSGCLGDHAWTVN